MPEKRAFDRAVKRRWDLSDPDQVILHHFLFIKKLIGVVQVLPFTSSAGAEMAAKRSCPFFTEPMETDNPGFTPRFFFSDDPQVCHITRNGVRDKNYQVSDTGHGIPFRPGVEDLHLFKNQQFIFTFSHSVLNLPILHKQRYRRP